MKYNKFIKSSFLASLIAFAAVSCSDEVNYGNIQAPDVNDPDAELLFVTDENGNATQTVDVEFRDNKQVPMVINSTKPASKAHNVQFAYDATALDEFNKTHGTELVAIPESFVQFENGGIAALQQGETQSQPVQMTLTSDGSLDHEATYAVPVRVTTTTGTVAASSATRIYVVRDLTALPDCHKTVLDEEGNEVDGVKIFSCMEVNDTNPLNNLRYTLKNSGKYMVDALIIFSGNINYDPDRACVYFNANPNVQALLDNREKYLKPLQDRGMKVIMGVMCNHDRACIANLGPEAAKLFAKELKALCDAYQLDGIFWDDEYCSPLNPPPPGFDERSSAAWSRLAYEVWNLQPDRWNIAYGYSNTSSAIAINGVEPGTYISYYLPDYGSWYSDVSEEFPGMTLSQMGGCSMEFAQGRWYATETTLRNMRNDGYGAMMVFAMDPYRENADGQDAAMAKLAKAFYNDEVVIDPTKYPKDWK